MAHTHDHNHDHAGHSHGLRASSANQVRLAWTLALAGGYMVAEAVGGWLTNSLALMADAGHMLSDVAALGLSLFALWFAKRPATPHRSYGSYRAEILAALANAATLVAIAVFIIIEAIGRLSDPPQVQGGMMMVIAVGGLVVNLVGLWILNAGRSESLNVQGAWLHVLTDALGSVGAIVAGLLVWLLRWNLADPLVSILVAMLVMYSAWSLMAQSVSVLMEHAPRGIDVDRVRDAMIAVPGVVSVHDLHVWSITSGMVSLSAHVEIDDESRHGEIMKALRTILREQFGLDHATLQIEPPGFDETRPGW